MLTFLDGASVSRRMLSGLFSRRRGSSSDRLQRCSMVKTSSCFSLNDVFRLTSSSSSCSIGMSELTCSGTETSWPRDSTRPSSWLQVLTSSSMWLSHSLKSKDYFLCFYSLVPLIVECLLFQPIKISQCTYIIFKLYTHNSQSIWIPCYNTRLPPK